MLTPRSCPTSCQPESSLPGNVRRWLNDGAWQTQKLLLKANENKRPASALPSKHLLSKSAMLPVENVSLASCARLPKTQKRYGKFSPILVIHIFIRLSRHFCSVVDALNYYHKYHQPHPRLPQMDGTKDIQFDWTLDPKALWDIYKGTEFGHKFQRQIAKDVIGVLSPQLIKEPYNLTYDDELIYKRLIGPLEQFIFDAPEDKVGPILEQLRKLKQPSKVCRKVLKTGDVLFSCNDCGLDETCVVCIDCFHKSAHKNHNYKMSNTDGGGCCDCGDHEAWRQNPACSDHQANDQANLKLADFEDIQMRRRQIEDDKKGILEKISLLPEGYAARFFLVCQASLQYARMMLSWANPLKLPESLNVTDESLASLMCKEHSSNNFFTVLFNDEVHTYDHVITTLHKIIKCTKKTASVIASSVSREGRSLILQDAYRPCKQISDSIACVRDSGAGPLKVEVIHGSILAHQAFALKLIEWVKQMSLVCDAFRVLTAYTILGGLDQIPEVEESASNMTLLEKVMRSNTSYWKLARIDWNDLFVATLLTEYSIKDRFARLITRNYPNLVTDFMHDDHDHSVSILTMTTQLYTVPSLVCMLIEEENALSIIARKLIEVCLNSKRENTSITFDNRNTFDMHGLRRGFYIIPDIKHLINIEPTRWTDGLRTNVVEAVIIFMDLLESMQNMDSVKRQLGQHLEYEQEWETGMTLQSRLITLISRLVAYCSLDETILIAVLSNAQQRLFTKFSNFKTIMRNIFDHEAQCIHYDVSLSPVSVHLPLTRFAAALIIELMQRRPCDRVPYDESLIALVKTNDSSNLMRDIMEPSLRTEVMIAQSRSGMWRRNGFSLNNQIIYFSGALMRKEMYDRDILVLQEAAATCEPNRFLIHLINKFNLITWVTLETTREPSIEFKEVSMHYDEENMTQTMSLGEEFLQLLLTIISERYRVGIGKVTSEDVVKNEIIQLLCIGPFLRSDITQKLFYRDHEIDCIKSVADLRRPNELSTGKYELKAEFYERFNPFFYHYNRQYQSLALDAQLKRKRDAKEPLICCPPPKPVELTPQFRNLNNLLNCDITLIIIQKVLRRASGPQSQTGEESSKSPIHFSASDLQLDQCLHLIGLGLHEQERDLQFNYIAAAHSTQIWSLLKDCYEKAKRSRDLISWIMQKANALLARLEGNGCECDIEAIKQYFEAVLGACDTNKQDSKRRSSELASQRRERIMAQMKAKQDKFLSNPATKELAADTAKHEAPRTSAAKSRVPASVKNRNVDEQLTGMDYELTDEDDGANYAPIHLCILCRDEQAVAFDQPTMVLLAYVQRSAVLSKNRKERRIPNYSITPSNHLKHCNTPEKHSYTSDNGCFFDATHMPADLFFGPYISTCGHAMHHDCWRRFSDAVTKRETTRPNRGSRHTSFDLEKNEILCPLCECISNATIPLMPDYTRFTQRQKSATTVFESRERASENLTAFLHALKGTVATYKHVRHLNTSRSGQASSSSGFEDKYMRLLQPTTINDVLKELDESEALILRDFIATIRRDKIQSSSCTKNLLSSIQAMAERIHSVALDLDRSVVDVHHARIFMMTSWSLSYTIQAHERATRFKGSPLFEELESSKNLCLSSLVRFACASMMTHQSDMIQSLLVQKLRFLLVSEEHQMSSLCVLDIDAFELFLSIFVMLQKLYSHVDKTQQQPQQPIQSDPLDLNISSSNPLSIVAHSTRFSTATPTCVVDAHTGGNSAESLPAPIAGTSSSSYAWTTSAYDHEYFRNLLHLMIIFNLLQVTITIQTDGFDDESAVASNDMEAVVLNNFYEDIILASGHPKSKLYKPSMKFVEHVKCALLPFLRSCAIFFYQLSHVKPNETLRTMSAFRKGGDLWPTQTADESSAPANHLAEFNAICEYLSLPNDFHRLLESRESRNLALSWLRHSRVLMLIKSVDQKGPKNLPEEEKELMPVKLIRQPHSLNRLIDLPYDYSELVDRVSNFTCPSIKNEDSRTPTMCLVCGVMLCSQSYCCQRDLNDLASNYQQTIKRQEERDQQLLASNAALAEGGPSGAGSVGERGFSRGSGATVAANLHTTNGNPLNAISLLFYPHGAREEQQNSPLRGADSRWPASQAYSLFQGHISQQLVGSCTYHAHECSGGVGIFLRIRSCQLLLLSGRSKGCYMPAPYIDDHGESDFGLARGNPLHLNRLHYESIQQLWMNHAIPEHISRSLEYSSYASNIHWHLH